MLIESFAGFLPVALVELAFILIVGVLVVRELEPPAPWFQKIAAQSLDRVLIVIGATTIAFQVLWIFSRIGSA